MGAMTSEPLKALFYTFESGLLALPAGTPRLIFLNGRLCSGLSALAEQSAVEILQYDYEEASALQAAGYRVSSDDAPLTGPAGFFDGALVCASRHHQESLFYMATALSVLKPGGLFVCAAANDAGGRRLKKDAAFFGSSCAEISKYHARVIWATRGESLENQKIEEARRTVAPQKTEDGFTSRPGIFSWNRIDEGSALLAESLPSQTLAGRGADFGCGYGFLGHHVLSHNPDISALTCIDADARAVACCRASLEGLPVTAKTDYIWKDARDSGLHDLDFVITNPPFHRDKEESVRLGASFIESASRALRAGGSLWLVANAHLPYEKILFMHFPECQKVAERRGYKVYHARK